MGISGVRLKFKARNIFFVFFSLLFFLSSNSIFGRGPKISIITSLYKGEQFIEGFMKDIVRQTVFDQCELIIINANSPENEEPYIQPYLEKYPNIFYFRLAEDPGLYGVWNLGIKMAQGQYITNANVDDRLHPACYEIHSKALDDNPQIDLVYSDFFWTDKPNELYEHHSARVYSGTKPFSRKAMVRNLPGPNPMWRKSVHTKHGFFDETFRIVGDWEMWCRSAKGGSVFLKVEKILSLFYKNPNGLSTSQELWPKAERERRRVIERHKSLWRDS